MDSGSKNIRDYIYIFIKSVLPFGMGGGIFLMILLFLMKFTSNKSDLIILASEIFLITFLFYCIYMLIKLKRRKKLEKQYAELSQKYQQKVNDMAELKTDILDFFLVWVHQIKTPIAASKLLLSSSKLVDGHDSVSNLNTAERRQLRAEVLQIEKYSDMALGYLKLSNDDTEIFVDYVDLNKIIKSLLKKYAVLFINEDINVQYTEIERNVISDSNWLTLAIEQLISNEAKYATGESVKIYFSDEENSLVIKDTGIGISESDLPKIFDRGYSGFNGKGYRNSTGIGLYLAKKIFDRLGCKIHVESREGVGSEFRILFPRDLI
ncbi:MAG: sensor histidine kinase [Christensenellales bacterium]